MDEFSMVPLYRNGIGEITNGFDIPVPMFCKKHYMCNPKCKEYYMRLESAKAGFYTCPFGFQSYVFNIDNNYDNYIFTCLKVQGHYDRNKINPKIKNESKSYRELTEENVLTCATAYLEFMKNQSQYDEYKKLIDDIFHDLRKFNGDIKRKNERIFKKAQQSKRMGDILEASKSIIATSWFISVRLNNHDFIYNEELMNADIKSQYNIFRIFDKVKKCMTDRINDSNLKVVLCSIRDCRDMKAYECIELLPYILLDNAIKYSPRGEKINITFSEKEEKQHVKVESIGPFSPQDEIHRLFDQGFRGTNATSSNVKGMGIGLYTAKKICDLNNIVIKITSDSDNIKYIDKLKYSKFTVDFWIIL